MNDDRQSVDPSLPFTLKAPTAYPFFGEHAFRLRFWLGGATPFAEGLALGGQKDRPEGENLVFVGTDVEADQQRPLRGHDVEFGLVLPSCRLLGCRSGLPPGWRHRSGRSSGRSASVGRVRQSVEAADRAHDGVGAGGQGLFGLHTGQAIERRHRLLIPGSGVQLEPVRDGSRSSSADRSRPRPDRTGSFPSDGLASSWRRGPVPRVVALGQQRHPCPIVLDEAIVFAGQRAGGGIFDRLSVARLWNSSKSFCIALKALPRSAVLAIKALSSVLRATA